MVFHRNGDMISRMPQTTRSKVYHYKQFQAEFGTQLSLDYEETKTFFQNFGELFRSVDHPNFIHYAPSENCDYVDSANSSKNGYLSNVVVFDCENIGYSNIIRDHVSDCFNSLYVVKNSHNIYWSI